MENIEMKAFSFMALSFASSSISIKLGEGIMNFSLYQISELGFNFSLCLSIVLFGIACYLADKTDIPLDCHPEIMNTFKVSLAVSFIFLILLFFKA